MEKLKPLIVPQNTLDLKNFTDFCKIHKNYVDTAEFYKQQLDQRKNETNNYGLKILFEHFLKTDKEWKNILSKKDLKIIDKLCKRTKDQENWVFRCLKSGNFYIICPYIFFIDNGRKSLFDNNPKLRIQDSFKIKDNKIILKFYYPGISIAATCYRQGKNITHVETYTIDLLDYSILFEKSENISYSSWEPFKSRY